MAGANNFYITSIKERYYDVTVGCARLEGPKGRNVGTFRGTAL